MEVIFLDSCHHFLPALNASLTLGIHNRAGRLSFHIANGFVIYKSYVKMDSSVCYWFQFGVPNFKSCLTASVLLGLLYLASVVLLKTNRANAHLSLVALAPGEGEYNCDTLALSLIIVAVKAQHVRPISIALGVLWSRSAPPASSHFRSPVASAL